MPRMFQKRIRKLLKKLDTQSIREEAILQLKELAKEAHQKAMKGRPAKERSNWGRLEAYVYQTINSLAREYEEKNIREKLKELDQRLNKLIEGKATP